MYVEAHLNAKYVHCSVQIRDPVENGLKNPRLQSLGVWLLWFAVQEN